MNAHVSERKVQALLFGSNVIPFFESANRLAEVAPSFKLGIN